MADAPFRSAEIYYQQGDVLILYTDGIVEARNPAGDDFGEERLARFLDAHHHGSADEILSGLWTTVEHFTQGGERDDAAVMMVKFD